MSRHHTSVSTHHRSSICCILMRCSRWIRLSSVPFCTLFNFFLDSFDKPASHPYWNMVCFCVMKTQIIHQQKDLFKEDRFVIRRQAKKSSRQAAWRPPTPRNSEDIAYIVSYWYRAHSHPSLFSRRLSILSAFFGRTFESWSCLWYRLLRRSAVGILLSPNYQQPFLTFFFFQKLAQCSFHLAL